MSVLSHPSFCSPLASAPPHYEDDGDDAYSKQDVQSSVGEEQPIPRPTTQVRAKRQREAVGGGEGGRGGGDNEDTRQRKRRKTEFTQSTLVNPTQYNPFRGSPLSRAATSERPPSQDLQTPTRLPLQRLRVMDFTAGRAKRRETIAQQVADQTFGLEHEEDEDEEPEEAIQPKEGSLLLSGRRQEEEDFGEVAELQAPKRQRKGRFNLDLIPAMTYQSEITFFVYYSHQLTL